MLLMKLDNNNNNNEGEKNRMILQSTKADTLTYFGRFLILTNKNIYKEY